MPNNFHWSPIFQRTLELRELGIAHLDKLSWQACNLDNTGASWILVSISVYM